MLDTEPTGSDQADTTSTASPADTTTTPRKRTTKRAAKAAPAAAVEPTDAPAPVKRVGKAAKTAVSAPDELSTEDSATPVKKAARKAVRQAAPADPGAEPVAEKAPAKRTRKAAKKAAPATDLLDSTSDDDTAPAASPAPALAAPLAPMALFVAPDPAAAVVVPARRTRTRKAAPATDTIDEAPADEVGEVVSVEDSAEDDTDESGRPRRRRGRRGRGRGKGGLDEAAAPETADATEEESEPADEATDDEGEPTGTSRRRRRRRRGGGGGEDGASDDSPRTVTRVREPRTASDEVQGVKGSTRLEAKRQRRRDGRDQSRRRPPVLSESEFLARREAVERVMVVRQAGDRTQIAVLEDNVLVEHYVTKATSSSYAGNVYLGRVQNVLPSMEAAFVDIGKGRNAVLYAGEVNWDLAGMDGKARKIEQALKSGDSVLVQVTKDPIGHKGARLTSQISLPGRFLVYVPEGQMTGISRKLPDTERKRLKDILKKIVPENAGVIIRTAAEGASEEELTRDVARLQAQWDAIKAKSEKGQAPVQLSEEPDLVVRVIRDIFNEDFTKLVVSGDEAWDLVEQYVEHVSPDLVPRLSKHTADTDVFHDLRIDEQLAKGLDRKVWLPSGGSLVIDRTEAMTVIDVNTGKFTGQGGNLEETVTRNNLEAAEEIVRQLRLRDIGGMIVVDFIDMVLESNRELVLRRLTECLGRDRTKHQVAEVTSLGLVQMTRKRVGQGLLEVFSETCEHCKGRGVIVHSEPVDRSRPVAPVKAVAKPRPPSGLPPVVLPGEESETVAVPDVPAEEPTESRPKRRRGGRGRGRSAEAAADSAADQAAAADSAVVDSGVDVAGADEAVVVAPSAPEAVEDSAAVRDVTDVRDEAAAPAPKRRRRAASRPAGPPSGVPAGAV